MTGVSSHCWTVTFRLCDLRLCRPQPQRVYMIRWSHDVFSYLAIYSLIGADLSGYDSVEKISFFSVWKSSVPDGVSPVVLPWFWRQLDTVSSLLPQLSFSLCQPMTASPGRCLQSMSLFILITGFSKTACPHRVRGVRVVNSVFINLLSVSGSVENNIQYEATKK